MHHYLFTSPQTHQWQASFNKTEQEAAVAALEEGQLIYFPSLAFELAEDEHCFLSTRYSTQKRKNISYNKLTHALRGVQDLDEAESEKLKSLLNRYATQAKILVDNIFPSYSSELIWGRTSYRPVPVVGRISSYRKDDKRLHVDAFPSSPNQGKRILRVFCNINPRGEDRVWRIGEPFAQMAQRFLPHIKKPFPGAAKWMHKLGLTKSYRTHYDHLMLQLHDKMKKDENYQKTAEQRELRLAPGSSWIVQTDQVSHAAMSGQFMLEQTFYLPVQAMQNPELSPLRVLERLRECSLVA